VPIPPEFANFNIADGSVTVWLFKKSGGSNGAAPTFTGKWIATNEALDEALKSAVSDERARIEEVNEYSLLAQNNEASALSIGTIETHAGLIVGAAADPLPQKKVRNAKQIQNTDFYVIKLVHNGSVLHAVRKTDASWKSRRRSGSIAVFFSDDVLELETAPEFSISKKVDFFIIDDQILIASKPNFESVLNYRQAHAEDFASLQAEPEFSALFTNMAPLVAFVGSNKIQLRRVCAIHQKGHYRDNGFMDRLRAQHANYNLTINFNGAGLINPTAATCSDIITALLDHRLSSAFSENIYDVPDATLVA